jgi:hypothetical protein
MDPILRISEVSVVSVVHTPVSAVRNVSTPNFRQVLIIEDSSLHTYRLGVYISFQVDWGEPI